MKKTLDELVVGQECIVVKVEGEGKFRQRIFDMGITPGAKIKLKKVAPLGDPLDVVVRGYSLSLRRAEAKTVTVEVGGNK